MSFIQGNINSNEDLIEAMDAMRNMLTQGDYKAELKLELAEVNHKLAGFKGSELGGAQYARYGILHALKDNLEDNLHKLEEAEKEPQEDGYDDDDEDFYEDEDDSYDEDDDDDVVTISSLAFLEEILENINAKTQVEIDKLRKGNIGY